MCHLRLNKVLSLAIKGIIKLFPGWVIIYLTSKLYMWKVNGVALESPNKVPWKLLTRLSWRLLWIVTVTTRSIFMFLVVFSFTTIINAIFLGVHKKHQKLKIWCAMVQSWFSEVEQFPSQILFELRTNLRLLTRAGYNFNFIDSDSTYQFQLFSSPIC